MMSRWEICVLALAAQRCMPTSHVSTGWLISPLQCNGGRSARTHLQSHFRTTPPPTLQKLAPLLPRFGHEHCHTHAPLSSSPSFPCLSYPQFTFPSLTLRINPTCPFLPAPPSSWTIGSSPCVALPLPSHHRSSKCRRCAPLPKSRRKNHWMLRSGTPRRRLWQPKESSRRRVFASTEGRRRLSRSAWAVVGVAFASMEGRGADARIVGAAAFASMEGISTAARIVGAAVFASTEG